MEKLSDSESMLTVAQIAQKLNVNPRTVYRVLKDGEMPYYSIRGQKRVQQVDFATWFKRQRKEGNDKA